MRAALVHLPRLSVLFTRLRHHYLGDLCRGVVTSIQEYGAFVDLGGLDGLLHITDMSWGRTEQASELLHVGEEIEVRIKSIDEERDRVGLSLRDTPRDPWLDIESRFEVGSTVEGKVVRLMPRARAAWEMFWPWS